MGVGDNRIIQTDENGHERELIYDVFGKLRHERDKTTNQLLMSYEYDYYGDILSAFDYINSKSSYYTYNKGYRTLKNVETRDEETWFAQQSPTYHAQSGNSDKTGWTWYSESRCQQLEYKDSFNKFDHLQQTLKVNSGDYLFIKSPSLGNGTLSVSFKINGVWTDENLWRISRIDENKMAVKSVDELGIAGQEIQGIQFSSNTDSSCYIAKVGVLRGKSKSEQIQSIKYDYDYADSKKYIKMTRTVEGDSAGQYAKETSYIDNLGNIVKKQQYDTGSTVYTSEYTYDYLGNVLTERSPRANAEKWENPSATYEYDYAGRCVSVQNAEGNTAYTTYDSLGRKRSETDFNQHAVNYEYDTLGRAIKQSTVLDTVNGIELAHTKLIAYDNNGNVTTEWTSNNKVGEAVSYDKVAYEYTGKNQLAKTAAYKDQNSAEYTQYDYDAAGNLVRLYTGLSSPLTIHGLDSVSGGSEYSVTKYEYDYLNRLIKTTDALGQAETYVPNYNGGIDQKTDRNGNVTTNTYDEFAQLLKTEVTKPDGNMDHHTYVYNRLGQAVSVDGVSYEYDNLGRVIKETQDSTVKEYTYDGDGNRTGFKLTAGGSVQMSLEYTYTKTNLLDNVRNVVDNRVIEKYTYDNNGNVLSKDVPSSKQRTMYTYNAAGQVTEQSVTLKDGLVSAGSYSYEYGANGNQIRKKWSLNGQEQQTAEYVYDGLGRLTREKRGEETISYGYDAAGNRKQMSVMGTDSPFVTDYTYDKNNRLLSETKALTGQTELTEYQYDPNGNLISKMGSRTASPTGKEGVTLSAPESGVQTGLYGYNGFNQLTELMENGRTASYTYDANGLRTSKTVDGVTTGHIWDGMNLVAEMDSKGAVTGKYYRGLGLVYGEQAGQTQYYSTNAHGDVDMLSDAAGNVIKTYEYDAFGVERSRDQADTNPFRYAGEYYDGETDSIYLRARYYMPSMGRFTTEDPIRDGLNWYSYCSGNPVMFADPSGYEQEGDKEKYGENSVKYKLLVALGDAWRNTNSSDERAKLKAAADMIRGHDANVNSNNFTTALFINASDAAVYQGHNAVVLVNSNGEGIFFSYYPEGGTYPYANGQMRTRLMTAEQVNTLKRTGNVYSATALGKSSATSQSETYNRYIEVPITPSQGIKMMKKGFEYLTNPGTYNLIGNQCDNVTASIMSAGGKGYWVAARPNWSFEGVGKDWNLPIVNIGG